MNQGFLLGLLFFLCGMIGICFSVLSFAVLQTANNISPADAAVGVLFILSISLLAEGIAILRKNRDKPNS